jgi:hypothetical protein
VLSLSSSLSLPFWFEALPTYLPTSLHPAAMRFLPRLLHTGAAATILVIMYCLWMQHDGLEHRLHEAWHGTAHRVVVFGDDWSDTGRYRVPVATASVERDQSRGAVWTETLCEEVRYGGMALHCIALSAEMRREREC